MPRFDGVPVQRFEGEPVSEYEAFGKLEGVAHSALKGATLGTSDNLYGVYKAGTQGNPDGSDFFDTYRKNLTEYRGKQKAFEDQNPGLAFGSELAGGLATGGGLAYGMGKTALGKTLANATKDLNALTKFGITGGVPGTIAGAGYGDDQPIQGAVTGGMMGTTMGAVAPPLIAGVGRVAQTVASPITNRIKGYQSPDKWASQKLFQAIERDNITLDDFKKAVGNLDKDGVLADAGGENVRALVETIALLPSKAKNEAVEFLTKRQTGGGKRIEDIISEEISGQPANVQMIQAMDQARKIQAKPFYDMAYMSKDVSSDDLNKLILRIPDQAFKEAKEMSQMDGLIFPSIVQTSKDGQKKVVSGYGVEDIQQIKVGLDRLIEKETSDFGKVSGKGRKLTELKNQMLDMVDSQVPAYQVARKIYSDSHSNQGAMEMGRKFFRDDYDVIESNLARMSDSEKQFYKMGVARAFQDKLRNRATTGDKTRLFNKEVVWDKLRPLFDSDADLNRFIGKLSKEDQKSLTYTSVTGNSKTAARQASKEDLINSPDSLQGNSMMEMGVNAILGNKQQLSEPMVNSLNRMMLSNNPQTIDRSLQLLLKQKPRGPLLPQYAPYGATGLLGGGMGAATSNLLTD